MMSRLLTILAFLTSTLLVVACSSQTTIESDLGIRGAPDWVNEGTQVIENQKGRLLHGVGMAPSMNDSSLQKAAAENRARAEIARILSTYIDSTISDYSDSVGDKATMDIAREIRGTTQLALSGARILGFWTNKKTGDIYAFAELDLETMTRVVKAATSMNDAFKHYFINNADANFDRFIKSRSAAEAVQ